MRGKRTAANFKNSEDLSLDPESVSNWYAFHSLVLHPPTLKPACTPLSTFTSLKEGVSLQWEGSWEAMMPLRRSGRWGGKTGLTGKASHP